MFFSRGTKAPTIAGSTIETFSTLTAPPTTTITAPPTIKVLEFTSTEVFDIDLSNRESTAFQSKAEQIKQLIEPLYKAAFPSFIRFTVRSFRPGSTITNGDLAFSSTNIPSDDVIISTLSGSSVTSTLKIVVTSIKVINAGSTTVVPTTTTVFIPALANSNSPEFQKLAFSIVTVCDVIYSARYGLIFIRTIVIRFRGVARNRAELDTQAEVELEFRDNTPPESLPTSDDIVSTLKEAVSNPNNTFNITIDPASILILRTPNNVVELVFTSTDTFVDTLLDANSEAFKTRARVTAEQIEPVFKANFSSFISMTVTNFSAGSVVTTSSLAFNSSGRFPSANEIANSLINAVQRGQVNLNIDVNSIKVNGTAFAASTAGPGTKTSLLTTLCLVFTSLLFTHLW
ncbi:hypothetical protein ANANG_G00134460 [Anguilla anguilla]|uniref:SEA domain-containing protein n=1 Tax=Anguilla anguilla TaxID=7936 RepID=A0A9D3MBL7_ANGAN|nr:hypothetical protein ANANG_G00134460 [Anguilla anguilla]